MKKLLVGALLALISFTTSSKTFQESFELVKKYEAQAQEEQKKGNYAAASALYGKAMAELRDYRDNSRREQGLPPELLIFGDSNHKKFLGVLTKDQYNTDSICNRYGTYGSEYNSDSIWDRYSSYGDRYSDTSPWNPYASEPPVIVDRQGNFYGYFTINQNKNPSKGLIEFFNAVRDSRLPSGGRDLRDVFCEKILNI